MTVARTSGWLLTAVASIAIYLGALVPSSAQNLKQISLIVFPGGFNWPIWVGQDKGYFANHGVELKLTNTPNSVFQLTGLIEGRFDVAMTAIDNVVAYMEGQGEAKVNTTPDIFAFMGGDNGFLSLVSVPEVKKTTDLKGKTVSVDALTTGYAFVLLDLLERAGLQRDDYKVVKAGGVLQRWKELQEKKQAATMLITPFDIIAESMGFNVLQRAIDAYGHYQGLVGATRRDWAKKNKETLVNYIKAYIEALDWLADPANKEEAIGILRKHLSKMPAQIAAKSYDVLVPPKGFTPKAKIDIEGVRTVLKLRSEYGKPQKDLTDPMKYYDPTYYEAATK